MDSRLLARKRPDWTVPHSNTEHTCLTFVILSKINRYPVVKTVALKFLILRPHFDMDSTYWFLIFFWPIFEGNHFESIPKVRLACICIFHIHIHTRLTFGILSKINIYIYILGDWKNEFITQHLFSYNKKNICKLNLDGGIVISKKTLLKRCLISSHPVAQTVVLKFFWF